MKNTVWLLSYPRSGNTWVRFLLMAIQYPEVPVSYLELENYIPDFWQHFHRIPSIEETDNWTKGFNVKPVIIKSHFRFLPFYKNVIYLYRDPRDVLLSFYYYHNQNRISRDQTAEWIPFDIFFNMFLRGEITWGVWDNHVNFWLSFESVEKCLVSFEDLFNDTYSTVKKITEFLGLDVDRRMIEQAIDRVSFDKIRAIASRDGQHINLRGLSGRTGVGKETITDEQNDLIWKSFSKTMEMIGYKKERE